MIVVTGATGQLGRLVIHALLKKVPSSEIVAAVRSPQKASELAALGIEIRHADYSEPETVETALRGAEKVLLISSSEVGQRIGHHAAVIDAAKANGVKLLAYTSILHADRSTLALASEHKETEALIRDAGIPSVFLRNSWYTENYTAGIQNALALGAVYGCAGDGRISSATRIDYAEAAAAVLCATDTPERIYELAGDDSFSLTEFAAEISRQSGKEIPYVNLSQADYREALVKAGLPEGFASLLADSEAGIAKGELFDDQRQLHGLIGRATTSLKMAVASALATR